MALHKTFILHEGIVYPHYFLSNYLPLYLGADKMSGSLLNFKDGRQPDLGIWIDRALAGISSMQWPPGVLVIRALHHQETKAGTGGETPLDLLGLALASGIGGSYRPDLLRKTKPAPGIKRLPTREREEILKDIYYIGVPSQAPDIAVPPQLPVQPSGILLIDDILSTGSTARAIMQAIFGRFAREDFCLFTLARAAPYGNK
jgi:predicted amidophosphoribosyltransferase